MIVLLVHRVNVAHHITRSCSVDDVIHAIGLQLVHSMCHWKETNLSELMGSAMGSWERFLTRPSVWTMVCGEPGLLHPYSESQGHRWVSPAQ
ncbi:hypothetical protein SKAU_G00252110 [Synaphobranchus kaupii]|uniref:Uncharacterized protein n=1 Tax=Synaphobranchus kaupii TaxID=118154 RepID=A0A9Q1F392_SYNKA|nr:hypothetical protein SKAU_G00252110 [Synaphobranchus kaupii]